MQSQRYPLKEMGSGTQSEHSLEEIIGKLG